MSEHPVFHSGFVTIVGRPNVGKSTLMNALIREKIAIVSSRPQTTRSRVMGILTDPAYQIVFLDTPGIHQPRTQLGEYMMKAVRDAMDGMDTLLMLVDAGSVGYRDLEIAKEMASKRCPRILALNKIDLLPKADLLAVIARFGEFGFDAVVPISAKTGDGLGELTAELVKHLPEGPHYFPDDMVTDQPERNLCAELIREKLLQCLDREVPHGTAVEITRFSERDSGIIDLEATIYCEKASHKGIIIGKNGAMLKKVGEEARADIEEFMGTKVYLQTWVKVKENWRDSRSLLRNFGFSDT